MLTHRDCKRCDPLPDDDPEGYCAHREDYVRLDREACVDVDAREENKCEPSD